MLYRTQSMSFRSRSSQPITSQTKQHKIHKLKSKQCKI